MVGEGALSKLFACKVHDFMGFSVSSAATGARAPFRKSHVSLPTSAVSAPSWAHIRGYVALSCLDGFAQRMLLSKKDHQERVTKEGLSNVYYDPLLGHNDWVCSDFVCPLIKSGSFTSSRGQVSVWTLCAHKKNLSLCLFLDAS